MRRAALALHSTLSVIASVALAGCLREQAPVDNGRSLHRGRDIERPAFVVIDEQPWVQYDVRISAAVGRRGGVSDLWLVSWDEGVKRRLIENRSDAWGIDQDSSGVRYVMVDETTVETTAGTPTPVATLARVTMTGEVLERIPGVASFSVYGDRFFYRRPIAGEMMPALHLREGASDRMLGSSAGATQFAGAGGFYFLTGSDRTLSRVPSPGAEVQTLRNNVARFLLRFDERYAILTTSEASRPQTLVYDLQTRTEYPLPVSNPCCWIGFSSDGSEFIYSHTATGDAPVRLRFLNLATRTERVVDLPEGMADVTGILARPGAAGQGLYVDSQGRATLVMPDATPPLRVLPGRPVSPQYTDDGRYLLYVEPDGGATLSLEGRLMVQDADFTEAPRQISPTGALVPPGGFFFVRDDAGPVLVFWSRYGRRNSSDLFFANHETGERRMVSEGISQVTVTPKRVVGIVNISQQDLVGDLIQKNVATGEQRLIGRSVADLTIHGGRLAFLVRGRGASEWDGLWAATLE